MKTIRTFADRRPDLVEIQIQAAKLYCRDEYRHVVASTVDVEPFKDGHFEIWKKLDEICDRYGAEFLWFGHTPKEAALEQFFAPSDDWTLYLEEDVLPLAPFTIEQAKPAARFWGDQKQLINKTVQAWRERPADPGDWDPVSCYRVESLDDLPSYLPVELVRIYAAGMLAGKKEGWDYGAAFEILGDENQFVHLDKCGGVCKAWFLRAKDEFAFGVCDWLGLNKPSQSFRREADTLSAETKARHEAAVARGPKPIDGSKCKFRGDEIERRLCKTCKGESKIAVYSCEILGQCSDKTNVGASLCVNCRHFVDKNLGA